MALVIDFSADQLSIAVEKMHVCKATLLQFVPVNERHDGNRRGRVLSKCSRSLVTPVPPPPMRGLPQSRVQTIAGSSPCCISCPLPPRWRCPGGYRGAAQRRSRKPNMNEEKLYRGYRLQVSRFRGGVEGGHRCVGFGFCGKRNPAL